MAAVPDTWRAPRERGSGLLAMVFVTLSLAAIGLTYVAVIPSSLRAARERREQVQARYWAIEAASRARLSLRNHGTGNLDGNAVTGDVAEVDPEADDTSSGASAEGASGSDGEVAAEGTSALPAAGGGAVFGELSTAADGTYRVRTSMLPDETYLIESAAVMGGLVQHIAQVVRRRVLSPYTSAAFARTAIENDGARLIMTDSYDRLAGTYAEQAVNSEVTPDGKHWLYARKGGLLASDGSISAPNGAVFGSVTPGPDGSFSPSHHTYVSGTTSPSAEARDPKPLVYEIPTTNNNEALGTRLDSSGNFVSLWQAPIAIQPGTYVVSSWFTMSQRVVVRASATGEPVRIYVRGFFYLFSGSQLEVEPGAELIIYHDGGTMLIGGDGIINRSGSPDRVRFYLTRDPSGHGSGDRPEMILDSSQPFVGTVYGPESRILLRSQEHIYGSLVGEVVRFEGDRHALHYDESLKDLEDDAPRVIRFQNVGSWWITR